jgi:hypothetical protein
MSQRDGEASAAPLADGVDWAELKFGTSAKHAKATIVLRDFETRACMR